MRGSLPSFQRNEPGAVGGTDTRTTVLDGLVRDGEFAEVAANHLRLDFNLVEGFPLINTNHGSNHLGHDDHIPEMRFYNLRFLQRRSFLLGLPQFLEEGDMLPLETSSIATAGTTREQLGQSLIAHIQKLIEVHSSVRELLECPLLLHGLSLNKILISHDWFS